MVHILWEYRLRPGKKREFKRHYGRRGSWAALFRKSPGYKGTLLLSDRQRPNRYMTIDRWNRLASFRRFQRRFTKEYATLDRACARLTLKERCLGYFIIL